MSKIQSINIKFPLEDNNDNSFFQMSKITKDAVRSNLLLLLLTQKGERYYMPDYGTNLLKYLFEPNDNITETDVISELKETVSKYLPYVIIDDVIINLGVDNNQLNLKINFTYTEKAYSVSGELDIMF